MRTYRRQGIQGSKGRCYKQGHYCIFNPKLPIMVRVEASYNEGLSAGLFQQSAKGWQPVHFISRSLTVRCGKKVQSDRKGCVVCEMCQRSVRYVPSGCSKVYNRDSTQATIANVQQTVSKAFPRFEKWVMDMQDVDFEMKYEPVRDELDPLDFLSRHPLPVIGNDDREGGIEGSDYYRACNGIGQD